MSNRKFKNKKLLGREIFDDVRDMIIPKEVDHKSKKFIEEIIHNLKTDKSLSNRVIAAGVSSLERCYNIAVITEIGSNGRLVIKEWFKERRKPERVQRERDKNFDDIIII